jgi:hypothetical protein
VSIADQLLRRLGGHDGVHAVGTAAHVHRCRKLVDVDLVGSQSRFGGIRGGLVVVVFLLRGPLRSQLVVEIELRAVHSFGGLLGLPRQLAELSHRVIGRVGQHIAGGNPGQRN